MSSPTCSSSILPKTADNNGHKCDEVSKTVKTKCYVDECLKSAATKELCEDIRDLCAQAGIKLNKWISHNRTISLQLLVNTRQNRSKNLTWKKRGFLRTERSEFNGALKGTHSLSELLLWTNPSQRVMEVLYLLSALSMPFIIPISIYLEGQVLEGDCKEKCG